MAEPQKQDYLGRVNQVIEQAMEYFLVDTDKLSAPEMSDRWSLLEIIAKNIESCNEGNRIVIPLRKLPQPPQSPAKINPSQASQADYSAQPVRQNPSQSISQRIVEKPGIARNEQPGYANRPISSQAGRTDYGQRSISSQAGSAGYAPNPIIHGPSRLRNEDKSISSNPGIAHERSAPICQRPLEAVVRKDTSSPSSRIGYEPPCPRIPEAAKIAEPVAEEKPKEPISLENYAKINPVYQRKLSSLKETLGADSYSLQLYKDELVVTAQSNDSTGHEEFRTALVHGLKMAQAQSLESLFKYRSEGHELHISIRAEKGSDKAFDFLVAYADAIDPKKPFQTTM